MRSTWRRPSKPGIDCAPSSASRVNARRRRSSEWSSAWSPSWLDDRSRPTHRRHARVSLQPEDARRSPLPAHSPRVGAPSIPRGSRAATAARRASAAAHPARPRWCSRGCHRLDAVDSPPGGSVRRARGDSSRSGDGLRGRVARGLRRRVADETDVPLPLGVRARRRPRGSDPSALVAHQPSRESGRGAGSCDQAHAAVSAHVLSSCPPLGVTAETIQLWVDDVLRPWMRVLVSHLARRPYLFGERPSLADFALFGGNAAHFTNVPLCRRWVEEDGPAVVEHTHRLLEPEDQEFGSWDDPSRVHDTLIAVLAELGKRYLPWVSRACVDGVADVVFPNGTCVPVRATDFLRDARATLLARYLEHRSERLDAVLERAGILPFFADHVGLAGPIPDVREPPRPALNRPFPPAEG